MSFGLDLKVGNAVNLQIGNDQVNGRYGDGCQVPQEHHHHCDGSIGFSGNQNNRASYNNTLTQHVGPCGQVIRNAKIHQDGPNGHVDREITQGKGPCGNFYQEIISYNGSNRGGCPPGGCCNCC